FRRHPLGFDPLRLLALGAGLQPGLSRSEDLLGGLWTDPRDVRQPVEPCAGDGVQALEAALLQLLNELLAHAFETGHLAGVPCHTLHLGLNLALLFLLALDVDFPAGETRRQAHVLSLLA